MNLSGFSQHAYMGSSSSRRIEVHYNNHYDYVTLRDRHYIRNLEMYFIKDIMLSGRYCVVREPVEFPINCYFPEPIPVDIWRDLYPTVNKCNIPKKWNSVRIVPFKNIHYNWLDSSGKKCEMWRKTPEFTHDYVVLYLRKECPEFFNNKDFYIRKEGKTVEGKVDENEYDIVFSH